MKTRSTKRVGSLLLTIAMLLAMVPCITINASAESVGTWSTGASSATWPTDQYLIPVDLVSANTTYHISTSAAYDWSSLSLTSIGYSSTSNAWWAQEINKSTSPFEVVGSFTATTVSSFILSGDDYTQRSAFVVSFRKAGTEEWVTVEPHTYTGKIGTSFLTCTISDTYADQKFDQVKITLSDRNAYANTSGFAFFTKDATASHWVNATEVDSSSSFAGAWSISNKAQISKQGAAGAPVTTVAKLEYPTVIDMVEIVGGTYAARARFSEVYASVDGENWDLIDTFTIPDSADKGTFTVDCVSETAYNYVKIKQRDAYADDNIWWSAVRLGVYGTEAETSVEMQGAQVKIDSSTYSVRFAATVDSLDYDSVGYTITASGDGVADKEWERTFTTVYTGIYEEVEGKDTPQLVEIEGKYFFVATVENISIDTYEQITFTVTPFAMKGGKKVSVGNEMVFTYDDGTLVTAS